VRDCLQSSPTARCIARRQNHHRRRIHRDCLCFRYAGQSSGPSGDASLQKSEAKKQDIAVAKKTRTAKEMKAAPRA
jgi:hypothetical protein